MKMRLIATTAIILAAFVGRGQAADDDQTKEDEKLLTDAKQAVTGDGLCDFFHKRTPVEGDLKRVPELIAKLGNDDFEVREKATQALLALGPSVVPILRKELDHPDLETRSRIRQCIEKLENEPTVDWSLASARLLRERKPKQAVEVLLGYLPWAASEEVENEVMLTLLALGVKDGKVQDDLAKALKDKSAPRRAAAALALARAGDAEQKKLAQQALKDEDP